MTDDLLTFLRQQLDDDERAAIETGASDHPAWRVVVTDEPSSPTPAQAAHIERHGPWRVLRRVAADRHIMAIHNRRADVFPAEAGGTFDNCCDGCGYEGICDDPVTEDVNDCPILRALALPFADRDGYREEWRP